jgi:hypothetical protein
MRDHNASAVSITYVNGTNQEKERVNEYECRGVLRERTIASSGY